ncbi:alcohol dehydrogenase catalytic domain-containing protein [Fructobacillus evanidus]|uniref:Threonine dehydrogenase or Mannitol dehydrogenase (Mdh) n=1 Tax=Fructobacillus evanidus TaxID=3064281 RepID=A0ABM9MVR9_9LACO|nr:Threonine dehydrogenase or Mannitol dehydrogenase (mdh) [Fructobacillus sp. LMG 32999]CAK1230538.1 Threonine dehydrogenase or Mannitol dehydrogenase (mdh) [Fructobacillus sp. LMG 32999]CAK1233304.1 Threonine dehydrogenase or Mannitol dehydrogenase (mdh) [Fructobacillus sp. LMG 32999]CAK1233490.1 Threonine dehydrogenase or Mannitol dehydrogenase (mdh) [Fructobacillus sp. LMG 32999]CAK1234589.1 Threonine dehydrogenase or Mannitol dehydrogenase (mdh) [Fructobacillus sp. LMG 32999]
MKAAIFVKPGQVEMQEVEKPTIQGPKDAVIKTVRASVCGSDLWFYRGIAKRDGGSQVGHEAIGIVEEVGSAVSNVQPGDFVIAPFTHGCGHCQACLAGFDGDCLDPDKGGSTGYQAEYIGFKNADWALVKIPGQPTDYSDDQLKSLMTLSDVMATGYHAAATAEVKEGDTVVVMGDGAVGLSGVIAAKLRGAKRIILMSCHEDRQELGKSFGATDIVAERDQAGIDQVMALTVAGADAILECVGSEQAVATAVQLGRPGAVVGRVGIPQDPMMNTNNLFWKNIGLRGGIAAVTTYDRELLLKAVLDGKINPGQVFTKQFALKDIQQAYEAMDQREAIKSLLVF